MSKPENLREKSRGAVIAVWILSTTLLVVGFALGQIRFEQLAQSSGDYESLKEDLLFLRLIAGGVVLCALFIGIFPGLMTRWARRHASELQSRHPSALVAMIAGVQLAESTEGTRWGPSSFLGSLAFLVVQEDKVSVWKGKWPGSLTEVAAVPTITITRVFQSSETRAKQKFSLINVESSEWREPTQFMLFSTDERTMRHASTALISSYIEKFEQFFKESRE